MCRILGFSGIFNEECIRIVRSLILAEERVILTARDWLFIIRRKINFSFRKRHKRFILHSKRL